MRLAGMFGGLQDKLTKDLRQASQLQQAFAVEIGGGEELESIQ